MGIDDLLDRYTILDLGCGFRTAPSAIGVDIDPRVEPHLLHDLDSYPYPLPSDHFTEVLCMDIIEHVADVGRFLREIHRVSRRGAIVRIRTPHFSSYYAYSDPTHRHVLGYSALDRYTLGFPDPRAVPLFQIRRKRLLFARVYRFLGIAALANAFPARYEQLFAFIFQAGNLYLEFKVAKSGQPLGTAHRQ